MSEAPRRIASTSTLLMNFTTGVSSFLLSMPPSLPGSSSPLETSRLSRPSASSRLPRASLDSIHTCIVRLMVSSSIRMGSTSRLVWNLTSSSAAVLVGSAMPTNSRPPRLNSGSTWCFCSSSSLTSRIALWLGSMTAGSNSGMPNSIELAAASCDGVTSFWSRR